MNIYTICNRPKSLKYGDEVVFKVNYIQYIHNVEDSFLSLCDSEDNDKIFEVSFSEKNRERLFHFQE